MDNCMDDRPHPRFAHVVGETVDPGRLTAALEYVRSD